VYRGSRVGKWSILRAIENLKIKINGQLYKWQRYLGKPENKRPVKDIVRYEKVIVWHNWFFAGQFVRQHINTTIRETVYNWH
jgi:hypothetical protein